jgi:hypothetical protein
LLLEKGVLRLIGTAPGVLMKNAEGDMQKTEIASGADISYLLKM